MYPYENVFQAVILNVLRNKKMNEMISLTSVQFPFLYDAEHLFPLWEDKHFSKYYYSAGHS